MDARDEISTSDETRTGPDLEAVQGVFERIARDGIVPGVTQMLTFCHDDLELRPYAAQAAGGDAALVDDLLRGKDAVLGFFKRNDEQGVTLSVRTKRFDVEGDTVCVRGSARVSRPDGSFAETSLSWNFHFRDGLVDEVNWEPRAGG